jgi:hypothetical protein
MTVPFLQAERPRALEDAGARCVPRDLAVGLDPGHEVLRGHPTPVPGQRRGVSATDHTLTRTLPSGAMMSSVAGLDRSVASSANVQSRSAERTVQSGGWPTR